MTSWGLLQPESASDPTAKIQMDQKSKYLVSQSCEDFSQQVIHSSRCLVLVLWDLDSFPTSITSLSAAAWAGWYLWSHHPSPSQATESGQKIIQRAAQVQQNQSIWGVGEGSCSLYYIKISSLNQLCQQGGGNTWPGGEEAEPRQRRAAHAAMASHLPFQ